MKTSILARRSSSIPLTIVVALAGASLAPSVFAQNDTAPAEAVQVAPVASPPKAGETAPDFELKDLTDKPVRLSTLAEKSPVVLVMLRGFPGYQCPFCTAQVGALLGHAEQFKAAGAHVLLVYPGLSDKVKERGAEFVNNKDLPANFSFVLDPDYAFTNQYGLRWDAEGETSYPATFVVNPKMKVLFSKVSHSHGDRASAEEILAALPK